MDTADTITLEFLRTGGPDNQLISTLTPYLAVCENQEPRTVHLPFDHHEYLIRQERLRYELRPDGGSADHEKVEAELLEMGRKISGLLGSVPGLAASFGSGGSHDSLIHLELVFSALELSLVPFEAVISPDGCPGPGQPLSLQTERPVSITRRQRAAVDSQVKWWKEPKILVAISSAGGLVPEQGNLAAMRAAIEPWIKPGKDLHAPDSSASIMHVVPNATLASIQEACANAEYTHIHILAHGSSRRVMGGDRFGVVLDGPGHKGRQVVSGADLAGAIRTHNGTTGRLSSPVCVTVAACDGGNTGTVVPPGGSVAQELHQAGIPLVIGSQFPLSSQGSITLVNALYPRLLRGDDPRVALHEVRQRLRLLAGVHDWASLIAYFADNKNIDKDLRRLRIEQARRAGKAAIAWGGWLGKHKQIPTDKDEKRFSAALELLEQAAPDPWDKCSNRTEGKSVQGEAQGARGEVLGLRGSILKQKADLVRTRGDDEHPRDPANRDRPAWLDDEEVFLEKARKEYLRGVRVGSFGTVLEDWGNVHWLVTQYLSLTLILKGVLEDDELFPLALASCEADLRSQDQTDSVWVYATRTELALLSAFSKRKYRVEEAWKDAIKYAEKYARAAEKNSFQTHSTSRQFKRYFGWFDDYLPRILENQVALARAIHQDIEHVFAGRAPEGPKDDLIHAVLDELSRKAPSTQSPTTPEQPPTP